MPNTCIYCGELKFESWFLFREHMVHNHLKKLKTELKPFNISGRSKAQIVEDVERIWLGEHII